MSEDNQAAANAAEYRAWLAPRGALELLKHLTIQQAKLALYDRLRFGHIRSMARQWNYKNETGEFYPITAQAWVDAEHGILVSDFWSTGQITISIRERSPAYGSQTFTLALFGVRFDPTGVRALLPPGTASTPNTVQSDHAGAPSTSRLSANKGGRPPKGWWEDLWIEIVRQVFNGELQPKRQADIEKAMTDWVSGQGQEVSERTIRGPARKLWHVVFDEGKN
jgi:hypothetical protein